MTEPRVRPARHLVWLLLKLLGRYGICLPPRGIYILRERLADGALLMHEMEHWYQAQRMGVVQFYWTYLRLLMRHGYRNHPMERV